MTDLHTLAREIKALSAKVSPFIGMEEMTERYGVCTKTIHDARHTAATWIVRTGRVDVLTLCKIFGWSDPKQAMVYFNPSVNEIAARL